MGFLWLGLGEPQLPLRLDHADHLGRDDQIGALRLGLLDQRGHLADIVLGVALGVGLHIGDGELGHQKSPGNERG